MFGSGGCPPKIEIIILQRGILQAGRPVQGNQESDEDSSEDQVEAIREGETASEDKKELEPEKEKNPRNQDEEARLEYYGMDAIAERWRDKPKGQEAASAGTEVGKEAEVS